MKSKSTRRKPARRKSRKSASMMGRIVGLFAGKNSIWRKGGLAAIARSFW